MGVFSNRMHHKCITNCEFKKKAVDKKFSCKQKDATQVVLFIGKDMSGRKQHFNNFKIEESIQLAASNLKGGKEQPAEQNSEH